MDIITLHMTETSCVVRPGKTARARRLFYAPGLQVFVVGAIGKRYDVAANAAMNYAISINIPARTLRKWESD